MNNKIKLLSGLLLLTLTMGCSRKVNDGEIKLLLPQVSNKLGAMSGTQVLTHIVVNVSGVGINPKILWQWDGHGPNDTMLAPPTEVRIPVPSGDNRLIQFLGVYRDMTTQSMILSYGHKVTPIVSGDNVVDITLTDFGVGGKEARITGQYVTDTQLISVGEKVGTGPTGLIAVEFMPPSAPEYPMIIQYEEMFDGWFNFFALEGVPFIYRHLRSNTILSGLNFNELKSQVTAAGAPESVSYISMPKLYWVEYGSGSTYRDDKEGSELIYGFFGPAKDQISHYSSTGVYACYEYGGGGVSIPSIFNASTGGSNLLWYSDVPSAGNFYRVGGGSYGSYCSIGVPFHNTLKVNHLTDFNDGKRVLGITGPFRKFTASPSFTSTSCNSNVGSRFQNSQALGCHDGSNNSLEVKWEYITDRLFATTLNPGKLDGVSVFVGKRPSCPNCNSDYPEFREPSSDGIKCQFLESLGLIKVGDYADPNIKSATLPNIVYNSSNERIVGFVCPYKNYPEGRKYFSSAARIEAFGVNQQQYTNASIYVNVNSASDPINDQFLIGTVNDINVTWGTSNLTASNYSVEIKDNSGTSYCGGMYYTTSSSYTFNSCYLSNESIQYKAIVKAYDSNSNMIVENQFYFYRVNTIPSLSSINTTLACTTWNSPLMKTINVEVNSTSSQNYYMEIIQNNTTTNSANIAHTTYPQTLSINTGMNDTGSSYIGSGIVSPCHSSGFCGNPAAFSFNITSGGACTLSPLSANVAIFKNLSSFSFNKNEFEVGVDLFNDLNANSQVMVKWCNHTLNPGCDPALGNATLMIRQNPPNKLSHYVHIPIVSPNLGGHQINFVIQPTDTDGTIISIPNLNGTVTISTNN